MTEPMTEPVLCVEGVAASYARSSWLGRRLAALSGRGAPALPLALEGISFRVGPGEVVGLIGPNGAGKSTLLRCVLGLQRLHSGRICVQNQHLAQWGRKALARTVAYVPQNGASAMSLRVVDMVALGRSPHLGLHPAAHDHAVVLDAIDRLGLRSLAMRAFSELSGGQRQRVLLARALAQHGKLLLLDEPTSDLDLRHQVAALGAVRQLADEQGTAALIAIHDLSLAGRFCDHLVMLQNGRVCAQGKWQAVLTPAQLTQVYGLPVSVGTHEGQPFVLPQPVMPQPVTPQLASEKPALSPV